MDPVYAESEVLNSSIDVFALGVTIHELYFGKSSVDLEPCLIDLLGQDLNMIELLYRCGEKRKKNMILSHTKFFSNKRNISDDTKEALDAIFEFIIKSQIIPLAGKNTNDIGSKRPEIEDFVGTLRTLLNKIDAQSRYLDDKHTLLNAIYEENPYVSQLANAEIYKNEGSDKFLV